MDAKKEKSSVAAQAEKQALPRTPGIHLYLRTRLMTLIDQLLGRKPSQKEVVSAQPPVQAALAEQVDAVPALPTVTPAEVDKLQKVVRAAGRRGISGKRFLGAAGSVLAAGGLLAACGVLINQGVAATQAPPTPEGTSAPVPTPQETPDDTIQAALLNEAQFNEYLGTELADKVRAACSAMPTCENPSFIVGYNSTLKSGYGMFEGAGGIPVNFARVQNGELDEPCGQIYLQRDAANPNKVKLVCDGPDVSYFVATKDNNQWFLTLPVNSVDPELGTILLDEGKHSGVIAYLQDKLDILTGPAIVETPEGTSLTYAPQETVFLGHAQTGCEVSIELLRDIAAGTGEYSVACGPTHDPLEGTPDSLQYQFVISQADAKTYLASAEAFALETGASDITLHLNGQENAKLRLTFTARKGNALIQRTGTTTDGTLVYSLDPYNMWPLVGSGFDPSGYGTVSIPLPDMLAGDNLTTQWENNSHDARYQVIEDEIGQARMVQVIDANNNVEWMLNPLYFPYKELLPAGTDLSKIWVVDVAGTMQVLDYTIPDEPKVLYTGTILDDGEGRFLSITWTEAKAPVETEVLNSMIIEIGSNKNVTFTISTEIGENDIRPTWKKLGIENISSNPNLADSNNKMSLFWQSMLFGFTDAGYTNFNETTGFEVPFETFLANSQDHPITNLLDLPDFVLDDVKEIELRFIDDEDPSMAGVAWKKARVEFVNGKLIFYTTTLKNNTEVPSILEPQYAQTGQAEMAADFVMNTPLFQWMSLYNKNLDPIGRKRQADLYALSGYHVGMPGDPWTYAQFMNYIATHGFWTSTLTNSSTP